MIQINELAREYLYEIGVSQLKVVELNGEHFAYCIDTHQSEYNYTQRKVYLIFTDRERWAGSNQRAFGLSLNKTKQWIINNGVAQLKRK